MRAALLCIALLAGGFVAGWLAGASDKASDVGQPSHGGLTQPASAAAAPLAEHASSQRLPRDQRQPRTDGATGYEDGLVSWLVEDGANALATILEDERYRADRQRALLLAMLIDPNLITADIWARTRNPITRQSIMSVAFSIYPHNPAALEAMAVNLDSADFDQMLKYARQQSAFTEDPASVRSAIIESLSADDGSNMNAYMAINMLVSLEGEAGIKFLANLPSSQAQQRALQNGFQQWLQESPAAAAEWLRSNPHAALRNHWAGVAHVWTTRDPTAAEAFASTLSGTARARYLIEMVQVIAAQKPERLSQTLLRYEDHQHFDALLLRAASSLENVDDALRLGEQLSDGKRQELHHNIAYRYFDSDPEAARAWWERLPSDTQAQLAPIAVRATSRTNFGEASELALSIAAEGQRNQALSELIGVGASAGEDVAELIQAISDQRQRRSVTNRALLSTPLDEDAIALGALLGLSSDEVLATRSGLR